MLSLHNMLLIALLFTFGALGAKLLIIIKQKRFIRLQHDCVRALHMLCRAITNYAQRDPALLHAEILKSLCMHYRKLDEQHAAKSLSLRVLKKDYALLERRAHMLSRIYENALADRADYSDKSIASALLQGVLDTAFEKAAALRAENDDRVRFLARSALAITHLKSEFESPSCNCRALYANCELLHIELSHADLLH